MTPAERYRKAAAQLTDCASREHTLKTAFIIISKKALQIECTVYVANRRNFAGTDDFRHPAIF